MMQVLGIGAAFIASVLSLILLTMMIFVPAPVTHPVVEPEEPPRRGSKDWFRQQLKIAEMEQAEYGEVKSEEARAVQHEYIDWLDSPWRKFYRQVGVRGGATYRQLTPPEDYYCSCGTKLATARGPEHAEWSWEYNRKYNSNSMDAAFYDLLSTQQYPYGYQWSLYWTYRVADDGLPLNEAKVFCSPAHMLRAGIQPGTKIEIRTPRYRVRASGGYVRVWKQGEVSYDWL